jgi:hypothetical protein
VSSPLDAGALRQREVIDALRRGTVPRRGLELYAVGVERFEAALDEELDTCARGSGVFKAVRGEYGNGKTFFARWLEQQAFRRGFAAALVQIAEKDTPLYQMETVYRRAVESLATREWADAAFPHLIERWFAALEDEALGTGTVDERDDAAVEHAVTGLLEQRLEPLRPTAPQFAAALRVAYAARLAGDRPLYDGLVAWLMGNPNVSADVSRKAGLKGKLDHTGAAGFLRGLLLLLKQTGRSGLVLTLDEAETIQRMRGDVRDKSLNALRQLIDDIGANRYPGLYLLVTGTPAFFDGAQGVRRLAPLAERLQADFSGDPRFDNALAVQIRLAPFDDGKLLEVGRKVRSLYPTKVPERLAARATDRVLDDLARGVAGQLGQRVGVAPRLYLRKLVDLLDKIEQHPDFDPALHYKALLDAREMTVEERAAGGHALGVDDVELDMRSPDEPSSDEP